jgi:O-antigen/teichoic acid export membrane protein
MSGYLRRLATTGAAYTAASIFSKVIAVALLPLYTRYLTKADYGAAEVLFAAVVTAAGGYRPAFLACAAVSGIASIFLFRR